MTRTRTAAAVLLAVARSVVHAYDSCLLNCLLLLQVEGTKSQFATKNVTPKKDVEVPSLPGKKAAPWIMGPVSKSVVVGWMDDSRAPAHH